MNEKKTSRSEMNADFAFLFGPHVPERVEQCCERQMSHAFLGPELFANI